MQFQQFQLMSPFSLSDGETPQGGRPCLSLCGPSYSITLANTTRGNLASGRSILRMRQKRSTPQVDGALLGCPLSQFPERATLKNTTPLSASFSAIGLLKGVSQQCGPHLGWYFKRNQNETNHGKKTRQHAAPHKYLNGEPCAYFVVFQPRALDIPHVKKRTFCAGLFGSHSCGHSSASDIEQQRSPLRASVLFQVPHI